MGREEADIDLLQCALLVAKHAHPALVSALRRCSAPARNTGLLLCPPPAPCVELREAEVLAASRGPYLIVAEGAHLHGMACQRLLLSKYTNAWTQTMIQRRCGKPHSVARCLARFPHRIRSCQSGTSGQAGVAPEAPVRGRRTRQLAAARSSSWRMMSGRCCRGPPPPSRPFRCAPQRRCSIPPAGSAPLFCGETSPIL